MSLYRDPAHDSILYDDDPHDIHDILRAIYKYIHTYTFYKLVTGFIVVALLIYRLLFSPRGWKILLYSGNTKAIGALSAP